MSDPQFADQFADQAAEQDQLLTRWRQGDREAGARLIRSHYGAVQSFFVGKVAANAVEDLVQSVFEVLCSTGLKRQVAHGVRCHIFAIARFKLLEHYRRTSKLRKRFDPLTHSLADVDGARSMVSLITSKRDLSALYVALRRLPLDAQLLIELKYYETFTETELSVIFEVSPAAMKSRIRRARARLTEELKQVWADSTTFANLASTEGDISRYLSSLRAQLSIL